MTNPTRRELVRLALTATVLTVFCAGGFFGLHRYNAHLEATGYEYLQPEIWIDLHIPLRVGWIWPYLSYYPMCFAPVFLLTSIENVRRIALAYAVQFGIAFACYAAFPMRMGQPEIVGEGPAVDAMRWLYATDPGYNIFPSLHTANAAMIACAFCRLHLRPWGLVFLLWAGVIAASTVLVKQHYVVDVVAGLLLAFVADRIAFRGWERTPHDPSGPVA